MSIALVKRGYDVTIFSMQDDITYNYSGTLYNFGLDKRKYGKVKAFLRLKNFFKKNNFDFIIDHRLRNKYLKEVVFSKFIFNNFRVIYCVHNYRLQYYFSFIKIPWLATFPHANRRVFVAVSYDIKEYLKNRLNISSKTIYNFYSPDEVSINKNKLLNSSYILGLGRLTTIKQFDKLIRSYKNSDLYGSGIKLIIQGDGPESDNLENLIRSLKLDNYVKLLPFKKHPYTLIKNAKALILTSKIEGFPMVIIEALHLSTPVVAFNCKSGPSEIIKTGVNGILVEDQNEEKLSIALNKLLDDNFYNEIKKNVSIDLDKFSEATIIQKWEALFKNNM